MYAVPCRSAGEITGTSWPRKAANGCMSRGGWARRRSPALLDQRSTLSTSPPSIIRYPMRPCSPGVSPVAIEHSAVAVVVGATVVIGPPASDVSTGISAAALLSCSQPEPVEDQQHDLLGGGDRRRHPRRQAGRPRLRPEQGGDDAAHVGAGVVRDERT